MRCFAPALRMLVLLTLPLVLNLTVPCAGLAVEKGRAAASDETARLDRRIDDLEKELNFYKALEQERRGAEEKVAVERMAGVNKSIDGLASRFGDVSTFSTMFGVLVAIGIAVIGYFVNRDATRAAREKAELWFEKNSTQLIERVNELEKIFESRANAAISNIKMGVVGSSDAISSGNDSRIIESEASIVKNKNKKDMSSRDYNVLAFDLYLKNDYIGAANLWVEAANLEKSYVQGATFLINAGISYTMADATEQSIAVYEKMIRRFGDSSDLNVQEKVAMALVNKGAALGKQRDTKGELSSYDDVVRRFGDARDPGLQRQVAMALANKGSTLAQQGKFDDALTAYDEVVHRFGDSLDPGVQEPVAMALLNKGVVFRKQGGGDGELSAYKEVVRRFGDSRDPGIQAQVAKAHNGLGFTLLMQAKENWSDHAKRTDLLNEALAHLEKSLPHTSKADRPIVLGNQAYTLFLLGRREEARPVLLRTLQEGGQKYYDIELDDSRQHPVPDDEAFRALLDELWAQVKPTLPRSMGGTADDPGDAPSGDNGGRDKG